MLPKHHRLGKNEDFKEVFKKGKSIRGNFILLKIKKADREYPRIGFVVGKKVAKHAAARNKIKRQLREAAKECIKEVKGAVDVVVVPSPEIGAKSLQEVRGEMRKVFEKAGIL